jgi:hypothetical protein
MEDVNKIRVHMQVLYCLVYVVHGRKAVCDPIL